MVTELTTNEPEVTKEKNEETVSEENLKRKLDDSTSGTPAKIPKTEENEKRKDSKKDPKASDIMVIY